MNIYSIEGLMYVDEEDGCMRFAVKDREYSHGERYVVCSLDEKQTKRLKEALKEKEEDKSLFYDPFAGHFNYLTMDEAQHFVNCNPELYTGDFVASIVSHIMPSENNDMRPCLIMQVREG